MGILPLKQLVGSSHSRIPNCCHGLDTGTIADLDKVYQIVQDTKEDGIDRPFISDCTSAFGIKPPDAPFIISKHRVHIFARDQKIARALKKLCDSHDRVWKNDRPIKVPREDQMKIPLVAGYQNMKLNSRVYPLSQQEKTIIYRIYDNLHEKGKIEWVRGPTQFAHPVFVVS